MVKPVNGFFCCVCKKFFATKLSEHCKTSQHYDKFVESIQAKKQRVANKKEALAQQVSFFIGSRPFIHLKKHFQLQDDAKSYVDESEDNSSTQESNWWFENANVFAYQIRTSECCVITIKGVEIYIVK